MTFVTPRKLVQLPLLARVFFAYKDLRVPIYVNAPKAADANALSTVTHICQHSSVLTKDYASSRERGDIASFYFADIRSFQATNCQLLFWFGLAVIAFFPFANDFSFIFGRPNEIIIDQFGHNLIIEIRQFRIFLNLGNIGYD
jgi:hypothetical protein